MPATEEVRKLAAYRDSFVDYRGLRHEADWLQARRVKAYERFCQIGFPTRRSEAWKYLALEPILNASFYPSPAQRTDKTSFNLDQFSIVADQGSRAVLVNGHYSQALSSAEALPEGVFLKDLASVIRFEEKRVQPFLSLDLEEEENPFAAINAFQFRDGIFLSIADGCEVSVPIHLLFAGLGSESAPPVFYPRVVISLGVGARATVLFDHVSLNAERYWMNSVLQIHLAKEAHFYGVAIHRESKSSLHFLSPRVHLAEKSCFQMTSCVQGDLTVRNDAQIFIEGTGTYSEWRGVSALSGRGQLFDHLTMNHQSANGTSRQFFKNILADAAQAEFNSLVHISPGAVQSDSRQLNRNLLLSEEARSYSRPQLKIDADDVQCSHGSATGPLEREELFYLQSRGLSEELAHFVMIYGFGEEILEGVEPISLRRHLEAMYRRQIEKMMIRK